MVLISGWLEDFITVKDHRNCEIVSVQVCMKQSSTEGTKVVGRLKITWYCVIKLEWAVQDLKEGLSTCPLGLATIS